MKKEMIWNDHIKDFIKIKLEKPFVLEELVKRESQFLKKRQAEEKIQALRNKYETLTKEFRKEHYQHEELMELAKKLQKEVSQLNGHIIKLEVEVQKQVCEAILKHPKEKEEPTRQSINSDSFPVKKQEELVALLTEHASARQSVSSEIAELRMRHSELSQEYQSSVEMLQVQLYKKQAQQQVKMAEESLTDLHGKLQAQKEKRKTLMTSISQAENRSSELRKSRDSYQINADQTNKKLQAFVKESKKVLMSSEGRSGKKYKDFIQKYRVFTKAEVEEIKKNYSETKSMQGRELRFSIFPFPIEPRTDKYQDLVIQIMKKFSNKSFTDEDYSNQEQKVIQISQYFSDLHHQSSLLTGQISQLKENLQKKIRNIQEMKMSPDFTRKSN